MTGGAARLQVMVKSPKCLTPIVCVRDVLTVLRDTTHHGFPVVLPQSASGNSEEEGGGQLEGLVLRSQILVLLRERCGSTPRCFLVAPAAARTEMRVSQMRFSQTRVQRRCR